MSQATQTPPVAPPSAPAGQKSVGVAYALWFFLGVIGVHQFYLGKVGRGVSYILTLGWLGIGLLIDLFTLPGQVRKANGQA
ncbi:MAG: TM2 domain-containing protein [Actinocatenispora sp.]